MLSLLGVCIVAGAAAPRAGALTVGEPPANGCPHRQGPTLARIMLAGTRGGASDPEQAERQAKEEAEKKRREVEEILSKEVARKKADDESRRKAEAECWREGGGAALRAILAKKKAAEEAAARKQAEEEKAAKRKTAEEAAVRKKAEEEAARKKAEEEEAARKKAQEEVVFTDIHGVSLRMYIFYDCVCAFSEWQPP